nr:hypothetical protein CFP56_61807 [Quercus suber]
MSLKKDIVVLGLTVGTEAPLVEVGKDKKVPTSIEDASSEDNILIRDMISQAKAVESKSDAGGAKLKATESMKK